MLVKCVVFLTTIVVCECVYSSFWAPLFDRRILNYRVDVAFDPEGGRANRDEYVKNYGVKGERLIADLGNGSGPSKSDRVYSDIQFYYTYREENAT